MKQAVKILSVKHLTHDVLNITTEKPSDFTYLPGQAVDVSINKEGWEQELRPFTFTSLPTDNHLEFTIKTYPSHKGVTAQLLQLHQGDELIVHEVFGDIQYKGEGLFIAGGAGITPFIAIIKHLETKNEIGNNKIIFANKRKEDIILESYFIQHLGNNFINVLSEEKQVGYNEGYITAELIKKYSNEHTKYYYLCGPEPMMDAVEKQLLSLGVKEEKIVKEGF